MVEFCGWSMPLQFPSAGIVQSASHTRASCSIFDVSHMLQLRFTGAKHGEFIERLIPTEVANLGHGKMAYSNLLNRKGGIIDDCIVTRYSDDEMVIVVNAGCADKDWEHFNREKAALGYSTVNIEKIDESLIAVQGPKAEAALQRHVDFDLSSLKFLNAAYVGQIAGVKGCRITRCGYTGEDGFEVSVPHKNVVDITRALYKEPEVLPAGLGARDLLRLEAMLPLYGSDLNEDITPVEANLNWIVSPSRRVDSPDSVPFLGDAVVRDQLANGTWKRRRQGFFVEGGIARSHSPVLCPTTQQVIGEITSGAFSPLLKRAVAMGYVDKAFSKVGTNVTIDVRGKHASAVVQGAKSFIPNTYAK